VGLYHLLPCRIAKVFKAIPQPEEVVTAVILSEFRDRVRHILEIKPEINFKQRDSGTTQGNYSRTLSQIGG
jgi:hypothetical protein